MSSATTGTSRRGSRWLLFLPIAVFAALAGLFFIRLYAGDASLLPSALIGRQVPHFDLPPLPDVQTSGLSDSDLRTGRVTLVNVFASWCVPCHTEHPVLMQISRDPQVKERVALVGLAYKDEPENTRRFLGQSGNPFVRIGIDASGRTAIDFGVYGVPETYVIKGDGTIAYRFIGPLSEESFRQVLLPQIIAASK
jgi:cytochrome c biogenesis protein CcmG/thiol:disulfide interchange protein DsbE